MVKCSTEIDENVQKQILTKQVKLGKVLTIVGGIGSALYCILSTIFENLKWLEVMLIFAVPFGIGAFILIYSNKILKDTKDKPFINYYEFCESTLKIESKTESGEFISKAEMPYKNFYKFVVKDEYFYLYINKKSLFPVLKSSLSDQERFEIVDIFTKENKIQSK